MSNAVPSIADLFQPLVGLPSWNVTKGHGSFLTIEFGTPRLKIREPRDVPNAMPRVRQLFARRLVTLHGQWHLWIYCCGWRIRMPGKVLAHNESTDEEIAEACRELNGQALTEVRHTTVVGQTYFGFDLGGVLETGPYNDELVEQWMLFLPDGNVYTYRSDGAVCFRPGNNNEEYVWIHGGSQ